MIDTNWLSWQSVINGLRVGVIVAGCLCLAINVLAGLRYWVGETRPRRDWVIGVLFSHCLLTMFGINAMIEKLGKPLSPVLPILGLAFLGAGIGHWRLADAIVERRFDGRDGSRTKSSISAT